MDSYLRFLGSIKEEQGPEGCAYWVGPNIVLTLSGERAFLDSVFWSNDESERKDWLRDLEQGLKILNKHFPTHYSVASITNVRKNEKFVGVEVITKSGISKLPEKSNLIGEITNSLEKVDDIDDFLQMIRSFLTLNIQESYGDELKNHIVTGLLLGYPDAAIIGLAEIWKNEDSGGKFAEGYIRADIRGADYYMCPQPVYDYPRSLIGDLDIKQHEKHWSKVLKDFYDSDFHKSLIGNTDFQKKIQDLSL